MAICKPPAVRMNTSPKELLGYLSYLIKLSKTFLSMSIVFGGLLLTACQTAPLPSATPASTSILTSVPSSVPTSVPTSNPLVVESEAIAKRSITMPSYESEADYTRETEDSYNDNEFSTENDSNDGFFDEENNYPIEPYLSSNQPPSQTTAPSYPASTTVSAPVYKTTYETDVSDATSRETYQTPPPKLPSRNELLERARQNSKQQTRQATSTNSSLPAFRNLMQVGVKQLKDGQLTAAENSFTRAQRMAPKSSAVYFYLAQVALKKHQPRKAEAMARRGLVVSQDASRRRALWQIILQSGQAQNNTRVINEAKQALR